MVRRSVLSVVIALSVGACDAFHAGPSLPLGLRAARGGHLCNAEMKASNKMGTPFQPPAAVAKAASSVLSGIVAASLILSPSIDVLSGPGQLSDGGVAHAQGATSKKSTRASPSTDANKDPESILRLSLPINEKNPIREAQAQLEMKMDKALREVKSEKWGKISGLNNRAIKIFSDKQKDILKDVPADRQDAAKALIADISKDLANLNTVIEGKKNAPVDTTKRAVLTKIGDLEQLMVKEFPYSIPKEFDNLPQLKGRATVEMVIKKANPEEKFDVDGTILDKLRLTIVLDGYSAPVTSGNVADLINRGFYNGMAVQRSDGFVIQTGDPNPEDEDAIHGFEPAKGKERTVPLEIMALEDKKPVYGVTLEDDGRPLSQPQLPFSVYGSLAMARLEDLPDSGSSQWFFLLFDPELVTSGRNLMDGRYSTFGYVIEGNRQLSNLNVGDVIESAKVVKGSENLINGVQPN